MNISIASGKGGTGKTTTAVNLAMAIGKNVQLLDCDVEGANAHLFIKPVFDHIETATTPTPRVNMEKCTLCGKCEEICQFKAILRLGDAIMTFEEMCHSCGGCMAVCPEKAITETTRDIGIIRRGRRDDLDFADGQLKVGEAMSPPLIRQVRSYEKPDKIRIIDSPPGTSCPVIASIRHADYVLLVTEPTPFGLHDLKLVVETVKILGIPGGLVINRCNIGNSDVYEYAQKNNLPILMEIPFDRTISEICSAGELLIHASDWKNRFIQLYDRISASV